METLSTAAAALAAFAPGAVWYLVLAEPWMQAIGVPRDGFGAGAVLKKTGRPRPIARDLPFTPRATYSPHVS